MYMFYLFIIYLLTTYRHIDIKKKLKSKYFFEVKLIVNNNFNSILA